MHDTKEAGLDEVRARRRTAMRSSSGKFFIGEKDEQDEDDSSATISMVLNLLVAPFDSFELVSLFRINQMI